MGTAEGLLDSHVEPSVAGLATATIPVAALGRAEYLEGVRRVQEYIAAGDVYQLVLASRFAGRHGLDPFQAYRALRLVNPSPYMFYCSFGETTVVGGVTIVAPLNLPATMPFHASLLFSRNLTAFLQAFTNDKMFQIDFNDDIQQGAVITHAGEVKHARTNEALHKAGT